MDPDQVDAADATAYADGCGCTGGDESWARALLRRGWDMSRKVAIAGVAATAAPVVAPPIIILSIAGVALSVPFAACLASLAATDRLMGALLPPAPPQPYYTYDLGDEESEQEFVDASEARDQDALVFGHWSKTEEDAIMEQNKRFSSLPLSREPRLSEELVPLLANEEGDSAGGEIEIQISDHELFVQRDGKHKENGTAMEVDSEYITMEAPSPGDLSVLEALALREEDNIVRRMEDAPVPAKESVQELSVSDIKNETQDGTSTTTTEMSSKEMLSSCSDATELSNLEVLMLGNEDNVILREGEGGVSVRKQGQDPRVSDSWDKTEQHKATEVMPQHELEASESPVQVLSKLEHEPAVEMALQEEMRDTNPVTGEVVDVQLDVIATAVPESESLQSRHEVARDLQAMTEPIYICDTLGSSLTEGIVKDTDNKSAEGVGHYGQGGVPSMVPGDDEKDLISSRSRPNVSSISDGTTSAGSKPHTDHLNQTTCVANKEHEKDEVAADKCVTTEETKTLDDKMSNSDMAAHDDRISKSLVPDYQSTREDEATVETVLEEVTSSIDHVTGEVVGVQVDIISRESKSRPMTDLVAQDLQVVTEAGTVDDKTEDIVKGISDTKVVDMEHQTGGDSSSFVTMTSFMTVDDGEDLMSSRSTPYVSAVNDDMTSVQARPDLEHHHETTGVEYNVKDREVETKVLAEDKDIYMEEQLREQLDTLRTITGYRAVPSLTLEGELAGLYIFVGVEPPHSSGGASNLTELDRKLRFLKSIIGVE